MLKKHNSIYTTTNQEKLAIAKSREQISRGEVISNDDIQQEINTRLKN